MNALEYSFIIPVFNRPDEVDELLNSLCALEGNIPFEVVIIEDGSTVNCKSITESYKDRLDVAYFYKSNSGPGDSRNYGMTKANGNYFIILDSDCLLPPQYLSVVNEELSKAYVDCYGGPDAADKSFSNLQKAINFAMTSVITTGGIRGSRSNHKKFQPRSFNMGISKVAFEASGGFGNIHPGEDPDLSIRLNKLGYKTRLISKAFVYHKRRISWTKFYKQVYKFGMVRPILNLWHPDSERLIYWMPTLFTIGFILAIVLAFFQLYVLIVVFALYFLVSFILAFIQTKNLIIAMMAVYAICVQFLGYGYGFFKSTFVIKVLGKNPEIYFPNLFFKNAV